MMASLCKVCLFRISQTYLQTQLLNKFQVRPHRKLLSSKFSNYGRCERNFLQRQTRCSFIKRMFRTQRNKEPPTKKGRGRIELAPGFEAMEGEMSFRKLVRPFFFTLGVTVCSFSCCAIWQYETMRSKAFRFVQSAQDIYTDLSPSRKYGSFRQKVNQYWSSMSEGQKVVAGIIGVNALVFWAWRIPGLQPTMVKWFCSNPASRQMSIPMILSSFSHYSFWHLAANMYVLWTFSTTAVAILGREQFLAMYMSASVISSFTSYMHKTAIARVGLSLGASGAILSVIGVVCTQVPHATLSVILIPWFTFTAGNAIKAIVFLDSTGVVLGWRIFDHAAHLGGALFGIWYSSYGNKMIWKKREALLNKWHEIRQPRR